MKKLYTQLVARLIPGMVKNEYHYLLHFWVISYPRNYTI